MKDDYTTLEDLVRTQYANVFGLTRYKKSKQRYMNFVTSCFLGLI